MDNNINDTSRDRALCIGVKSGSQKHLGKLYDSYAAKIYAIACKMNLPHEDAEEIVQETFLEIWNFRLKLNTDKSIQGLLITIAKRLVIKYTRRRLYDAAYQKYVRYLADSSFNETEDYVIFSDLEGYLAKGIEHMPPQRKQIFMLSKQRGLSNDEIAQKLSLSKRTVENHLYRASKAIRKHLRKGGITSSLVLWCLNALFL